MRLMIMLLLSRNTFMSRKVVCVYVMGAGKAGLKMKTCVFTLNGLSAR